MPYERQRAERWSGQEEGWPAEAEEGGQTPERRYSDDEVRPLPRQHAPSQGGADAPVQRLRRGRAQRQRLHRVAHCGGEGGHRQGEEDLPQLPQVVRAAPGSGAVPLGAKPPATSWGRFLF